MLTSMMALLFLAIVHRSPGHSFPSSLQNDYQKKTQGISNKIVSPPRKIRRYCLRLFRIYDKDEDGKLSESEWNAMKGTPANMDSNRDGFLTVREFERYVFDFGKNRSIRLVDPDDEDFLEKETNQTIPDPNQQNPKSAENDNSNQSTGTKRRTDTKFHVNASRLPSNLPEWFVSKDKNGDGQISLSEYSPRGTRAELQAFQKLDTNKDGVITSREISHPGKKKKSSRK